MPSCDPGVSVRGGVPARRSAVAAVAALVLAAGCDGGSLAGPDLAARTGRDLPVDELARLVEEHLAPGDFAEPAGDRLVMEVRGDLLFARGVVNANSQREAVALLNGSPNVRTLVLTWVPGSSDDETNLALGRVLRDAGMTTYLPAQAMAASGGTDLLLAGARRIVECGSLIGVHSWASGPVNGNEVPRDDPRHRFYLDYYREIGTPEAFYWFTLEAAPPDSIHWMNEDEMERYRIHTHFRPCGQGSATRAALPQRSPGASDDFGPGSDIPEQRDDGDIGCRGRTPGVSVVEQQLQRASAVLRVCASCSSTARICCSSTPGNHSTNSSTVAPAARFS